MHRRTIRTKIVFAIIITLLIPLPINSSNCINYASDFNLHEFNLSSLSVSYHKIFIELTNLKNITVREDFTLFNNQSSEIDSIKLYYNESFTILSLKEGNYDISSFNTTSYPISLSLEFNSPLQPNKTKDLKFLFCLNKKTQVLENDYHIFSYSYFDTYFTLLEFVTVRLSRNCEIGSEPGDILPPTDRPIITEEGFIDIYWRFEEISSSSNQFVQVKFKPPSKTPVWLFVIGPILGLASGIGGTLWYMRNKGKKTIKQIGKVFLSDSEKLLLKLIFKNDGKIAQKNLCSLTGYTKAKVSRILISLEKQNLVAREKWGRNYQIYISDLGRKVIE